MVISNSTWGFGGGLNYRWRQNGTLLAGATAASLIISPALATNAGDYTVIVSNSVGSVTSVTATVTVVIPAAVPMRPLS